MIEGFESVKQVAEKWGVNPRTVRAMCAHGRIEGAVKCGRDWIIPTTAQRPVDRRITSGEYINWRSERGEE